MKKTIFLLALFVFLSSFTRIAFAHVLESNGSVGAVMHISPDDAPVAGGRSDFFFEFKDKKNKFDPKNCNCVVSISQAGKEIFSEALFSNNPSPSLDSASFSFNFPQRDVYEVKITGKPSSGNSFEPFTLTYNIRVESEAKTTSPTSSTSPSFSNWIVTHIPHVIGVVLSLLILGFVMKKKSSGKK